MITDAQTRFSLAQALTTGTVVSTNAYDMGIARDIGSGHRLRIVVSADAAFTGGTSLQVNVVESANADLSAPTVLQNGPVIAEAQLVAGARLLDTTIPTTSKRHLGLQYVNTGTHTAGSVTGGIVLDRDTLGTFFVQTGY